MALEVILWSALYIHDKVVNSMQTKYNQLNVDKIYRPYSKKRDVIENIRFNTKGF